MLKNEKEVWMNIIDNCATVISEVVCEDPENNLSYVRKIRGKSNMNIY